MRSGGPDDGCHPSNQNFTWIPYCLSFAIVGWLWGVSPALVTIVLGFWAFTFFVLPPYGRLTFNDWDDVTMFGSFALAQFLIALLVAYQAVQHRRLLAAKQQIDSYARQLEQANHRKDLFLIRAAGGHLEVDITGNTGVTCSARLPLQPG